MTVHYFIGRTGTGKTETMHDDIIRQSKEDPAGQPIIFTGAGSNDVYLGTEVN
ncbi:hypothetical protein [Sinobaca sp. H24]|uniref:hypothetical protein n=1 Tax=Sinobaca sp. H24 TaxID=2923376 RepID=UPI0020792E7E|nr:hypothetical protein [Sinobaca sp. H24]